MYTSYMSERGMPSAREVFEESGNLPEFLQEINVLPERVMRFDEAMLYGPYGMYAVSACTGGLNNKLFKVSFEHPDEPPLMAKFYSYFDTGNMPAQGRLSREFRGLRFLDSEGVEGVPRARARDYKAFFGIYSFEEGITKSPVELSDVDVVRFVDFMVGLQRFGEHAMVGVTAPYTRQDFRDYLRATKKRFSHVQQTLNGYGDESLQLLNQNDMLSRIGEHMTDTEAELKWAKPEPLERTFCHRDLGTHNALFLPPSPERPDGVLKILDFEYCGLDDPIYDLVTFLCHNQMAGLSQENYRLAIDHFCRTSQLPTEALERIPRCIRAVQLEWIALSVQSLEPGRLIGQHYRDRNFDQQEFAKLQVRLIEQRLAWIDQTTP